MKMKIAVVKNSLLSAAILLCLSTQAMALPVAGVDVVQLDTNGGVKGRYTVDVKDVGQAIDYYTFCLEKYVFFEPNKPYAVDSVADYATSGGNGAVGGKDMLSDATKWFYWKYVTGAFEQSPEKVTTMQNIVWFLENEIQGLSALDLAQYNSWLNLAPVVDGVKDFSTPGYVVKALNISSNGIESQSQLIGESIPNTVVPEPTTMLLFGTGLAGLAAVGRRRRNS